MLQQNQNGKHLGMLPADIPHRDDFVGVSVIPSRPPYHSLRLSISTVTLNKLAGPKVLIRGTPENGYIISGSKSDGLTPSVNKGGNRAYIVWSAIKANAPEALRASVWMRCDFENGHFRIPPLPPAWIAGDPEFQPGQMCEEIERDLKLSRTAGDNALHVGSTSAPISPTVPPAKLPAPDYKLPEGTDIAGAQALLGRKLDEARAIMRELEKRTGLRFTLTRNFTITLDLSTGK